MGERRDSGETLIEILVTVVLVGLTFSALFAALASAGNAGNDHRGSVEADIVMRNFAEATKAAAKACAPGATYTVPYEPEGYVLTLSEAQPGTGGGTRPGVARPCPPVGAPQLLTLTVTDSAGTSDTMQLKVGTR
jgi:type II secretory pathway pseudopilin PulG